MTRRGRLFDTERGPVLAALLVALALVAMEATILATAVPAVVRDLGGFSAFAWIFSAYLLAQAATVPLYGRLADTIGRKPILVFGIGVFLVGSILCGTAWSMATLIVFRVLQGVGGGAVQAMVMTVVGDLYQDHERARVQGHVASVWALSSVTGPVLGALFADYLSWRGVFFIHIPLGLAAAWVILRRFHETAVARPSKLDLTGATLFVCSCSLLVFGLLHGGVGWRWESWASVLVLGSAVVLLVLFVVVELRVPAPMLPMWVFRRRLFAVGNAATLAVGAITLGVTAYLPTYTQAVLGDGALSAVAAIGPFNLGWPIGTAVIGRVYLRFGFRATAALGGGITVVAAICLAALGSDSSWYSVAATTLLLGIGMGVTASPLLIAVQSAVDWTERGMVTATFQLSRSLGSAVGVAAFGAVANLSLAASFARSSSGTMASSDLDAAARMLGSATRDDPAAQVVRAALFDASHAVFVAVLVCAVLMFLVLLLVPDRGRHADAG